MQNNVFISFLKWETNFKMILVGLSKFEFWTLTEFLVKNNFTILTKFSLLFIKSINIRNAKVDYSPRALFQVMSKNFDLF